MARNWLFPQLFWRRSFGTREPKCVSCASFAMRRLLSFHSTKFTLGSGPVVRGAGTSDIVDGHGVVCAMASGYTVISSDPFELRRLDPELRIIAV